MDPVTHIASGMLLGRSLRQRYPVRRLLLFSVIATFIPDMDNLGALVSPLFYLEHHRGITHSFFGGLLLAAAMAGTVRLFDRKSLFWADTAIAYTGILFHIYLDLATSYGTMIFMPFSDARYSFNAVFIIDPLFTGIAILFILASFLMKKKRTVFAVIGVAWMIGYPVANYGVSKYVQHEAKSRLDARAEHYERVDVTADILSPFYWKIVVDRGDSYGISSVSLLHLNAPLTFENYEKANGKLLTQLARRADIFRIYEWFSVYDVMSVEKTAEGTKMTFGDLRFYSTNPVGKSFLDRRGIPFTLTAWFDGEGRMVNYDYSRPGKLKFVQHVE